MYIGLHQFFSLLKTLPVMGVVMVNSGWPLALTMNLSSPVRVDWRCV